MRISLPRRFKEVSVYTRWWSNIGVDCSSHMIPCESLRHIIRSFSTHVIAQEIQGSQSLNRVKMRSVMKQISRLTRLLLRASANTSGSFSTYHVVVEIESRKRLETVVDLEEVVRANWLLSHLTLFECIGYISCSYVAELVASEIKISECLQKLMKAIGNQLFISPDFCWAHRPHNSFLQRRCYCSIGPK